MVQVIEKALKKLKLDAMIIQQGRLSDNKASVNKDDLLSMVRYGAEMVFSGGGGTITDEDIDAIIAKVHGCHVPPCIQPSLHDIVLLRRAVNLPINLPVNLPIKPPMNLPFNLPVNLPIKADTCIAKVLDGRLHANQCSLYGMIIILERASKPCPL